MRKCKNSVHRRQDFLASRVPCLCAISFGMSTTTKGNAQGLFDFEQSHHVVDDIDLAIFIVFHGEENQTWLDLSSMYTFW